ncbi:MAG: HAD-IA family hydrolase [Enhygromyxa sp.]
MSVLHEQRITFDREAMTFDAVVFDMDGVLIDSFHVTRKALQFAYHRVVGEGPAPIEAFRAHLGKGLAEILDLLELPRAMVEPFIEESNRLTATIPVVDGTREVLTRLRSAGLGLGVATGKDGARARRVLGELGLLEHFDLVVGSDEVERPKPAPDMIRKNLEHLACAPERALLIGDAPSDIRAGKGAGVTTAAALWGDTDERALRAERPDLCLTSMGEVLDVVLLGAVSLEHAALKPMESRA